MCPSSPCSTGGPTSPSVERGDPGTPSWLARVSGGGHGDPPAPCPPVQWRPAFLDLFVGDLQLRKASVSRMCWPLNLAGEAQVASGREGLASSHLERQTDAEIGGAMWQRGGQEPGFPWLQENPGMGPFHQHRTLLSGRGDPGHLPRTPWCRASPPPLHRTRGEGSGGGTGVLSPPEAPERAGALPGVVGERE